MISDVLFHIIINLRLHRRIEEDGSDEVSDEGL